MNELNIKLLGTNDAMVWAEEFVKTMQRNKWEPNDIDEGLMVGWFANAMVAQEMATEKTKTLESELSRYITCAYSHEGQFLDHFFPIEEGIDSNQELFELHMASTQTRIVTINELYEKTTTIIPTRIFVDWVDDVLG